MDDVVEVEESISNNEARVMVERKQPKISPQNSRIKFNRVLSNVLRQVLTVAKPAF